MLDGILILAAGEGRRMAPFSEQVPKPFFHIDGKPLIQHVIDYAHKHFRSVAPTVVSAQSKHLCWFDKVEGISSIIINNTGSNYYPILHLTGKWVVFCADLLLNADEDWEGFASHWVQSGKAVGLLPMKKPENFHRKGDQLQETWTEEQAEAYLPPSWSFVENGDYVLSGVSFIDASHSQVEGVSFGSFSEAWKMLTGAGQASFIKMQPPFIQGWHTFDTIREIADYEDSKLKDQIQIVSSMIESYSTKDGIKWKHVH